jgi:hypothetical protein
MASRCLPKIRKAAKAMEAKLVRLTPGELEGYLARLAPLTRVVRWNGVPVGLQEAAQRAIELGEESAVAAHGTDLFVTAG